MPGTVAGRVHYSDGTPVVAARVTLEPVHGTPLESTTDDDGGFVFQEVPEGAFTVTVSANGMTPISTDGVLPGGARLDLPMMTLAIAPVVTQVNAISQEQAAEMQVRAEEHQRIGGVIPNFFVVYDENPIPLTSKQKLRLSLRTLVDPATMAVSAIIAGGEQAADSYPGFGEGARGYARRFGASYGDGTTEILLGGWALPSLFHQDPRYFYQGSGSVRSRIRNVLKQTVEQKHDGGKWQFAWSNTLGSVGSALISNTYYPAEHDKWVALTGENFGLALASEAIANTLQEFVFGRITSHKAESNDGAGAP